MSVLRSHFGYLAGHGSPISQGGQARSAATALHPQGTLLLELQAWTLVVELAGQGAPRRPARPVLLDIEATLTAVVRQFGHEPTAPRCRAGPAHCRGVRSARCRLLRHTRGA